MLHVENKYSTTSQCINNICETVKKIKFCRGWDLGSNNKPSKNIIEERWTVNDTTSIHRFSKKCKKVSLFSSDVCQTCVHTHGFINASESEDEESSMLDDFENLHNLLDKILVENPHLCSFIKGQVDLAIKEDPRGRRWDKAILLSALRLWLRSPEGYKEFRNQDLFLLPHPNTLSNYKNQLKQKPGLNDEHFEWMHQEFYRLLQTKAVDETDLHGVLVLDEMYIQQDLTSYKTKDGIDLTGFVNLGEESTNIKTVREGKENVKLANQVLQFVYLGFNGFRFPIAHWPTATANAADMYVNMWQAIQKLFEYGFQVEGVVMDGGSSNRKLIELHFDNWEHAVKSNFTTTSPFNPDMKVTFIMDYSHVMKKIRNNIVKSGDDKEHTKLLTLPDNSTIEWDNWSDAYHWDIGNVWKVYRKLTSKHFKLDSASKMRNHFAEQVLDVNMLNLFMHYKTALGEYGSRLDGTIELIKHTSVLVEVFRDLRPIKDTCDDRLDHLTTALNWFTDWESQIEKKSKPVSKGGVRNSKSKKLISPQSRKDLTCCIVGFKALVERCVGMNIKPGLINSDIVENLFCSQRVVCGGSNDNPTYKKYCHNLSAIIYVQKLTSPKSNTGGKYGKIYDINLPPRKKITRKSKQSKKKSVTSEIDRE